MAGITAAQPGSEAGSELDFGLSTGGEQSRVLERSKTLARELGFSAAAIVRQMHGTKIVPASGCGPPGARLLCDADGLVASEPGVLLIVAVADCVPVYLAGPAGQTLALLHAGWRGTAGGILEAGVEMLQRRSIAPGDVRMHLGPAICGTCYEVGPEVTAALGRPAEAAHVDLREELAERARRVGIPASSLTVSHRCTRCGGDELFSHRGQGRAAGRMAAFLGRPAARAVAFSSHGRPSRQLR